MAQAKVGNNVKVHYTGKFDDGTVFDTSGDRDPLQFTIGKGQVIPGFEKAIIGMNLGESRTTKIPAQEAYGIHKKELVLEVSKTELPQDLNLQIGLQLQINQPDGQAVLVTTTQVTETTVTLDANHPLAGKDLTFDIKLVEVIV